MRHGCRTLTQIEILPKPPMERAEDNPWPEWPRVYRMDYGQEEAAAKFGADPRGYQMTVKKLVGDQDDQLTEIVTVGIRWEADANGALTPREVAGTEQTRPAQLVLLAMGFLGPEQPLLRDLGVATDGRSNVVAEHGSYTTSVKGVFAAGDCRRGQSLVVWAINEGRGAAREADRYLMGSTDLP
jgi:glutamate synthase (NADPH/NADH) small chain